MGDKKTLFGFEIKPLFGYKIRKLLSRFEIINFIWVQNNLFGYKISLFWYEIRLLLSRFEINFIWVRNKTIIFVINHVPYE